jgi:hypothetical protein
MAHSHARNVQDGLGSRGTQDKGAPHDDYGRTPARSAAPDRQTVEKRIAAIDRRLDAIQQGQLSQMMEWRELLLEKERLQTKLMDVD